MKRIIIKSILVLGLGVASGAALAQSQSGGQPADQSGTGATCTVGAANCPSGQSMSGSGAASGKKAEGKMNATTDQQAKGQAADCPAGTAGCKNGTMEGKKAEGKSGRVDKQAQGSTSGTTKKQAEGKASTTDQQAQDKDSSGTSAKGSTAGTTTTNQAQGQTNGSATTSGTAAQGSTSTTTDQAQGKSGTTTDQNSTASISNVTVEQKTQIVNVIHEEKVEPVTKVDFEITVGTAVPKRVHLHRVPARIVKIVPAYETYEYFVLADGRIVIVDPDTLEIVAVLTA